MTWHEDLALAIVDGVMPTSLTLGRSIVIGPPEDDDGTNDLCVGLVSRPGTIDETYTATQSRPLLQVVVRSEPNVPLGGYNLALDVWRVLRRIANQQVGNTWFIRVASQNSPERLRRDTKGRTDWVFDVEVWLDYEEDA